MGKVQKFGLLSASLLVINGTVGAGIFLLPGQCFAIMRTSSLLIYVFAALLSMALAACFAEVGGMFTRYGGPYVYAREAFGEFWGYEVGIMKFVVGIISGATMAAGFTTTLSAIWPQASQGVTKSLIIVALIGGFGIINIMGLNATKYTSNIVTVAKLIPLILLVVVGIFFIKGGNFTPFFPKELNGTSISSATLLTFYAFTGFASLGSAAEDIENPKKNVPLAIILSLGAVSVIYILIQIVCIGMLGPDLIKSTAPIVDAIKVLGPVGETIVIVGSLISILGVNLTVAFYTPRSAVALAEDGLLPKVFLKRSKKDSPYIAVMVYMVLAIPLALSGNFVQLAAINVIAKFTQYIPTCLAVMVFRKKRPDLETTFRAPFGFVVPIFALVVSAWMLYNSDMKKLAIGLGAMVVVAPFYFIKKYYDTSKSTNTYPSN